MCVCVCVCVCVSMYIYIYIGSVFLQKDFFSQFFFLVGSGEFCLHPNGIPLSFDISLSRNRISVMYHGQVMLVPILTAERNDPLTLSKHEATFGKKKQRSRKLRCTSCFSNVDELF